MKNSILEKARWLREVALATSKNNGARVAREWLKYAAMFVMLFTIGIGNAWGETVTYKQTSTSEASVSSGTAPKGSNVTFSNSYTTKEQLTSGKNMVLTLTSLGGINISNITLSMKSNKSGGAGKLSYSTDGGKNWTYLVGSSSQGTAFNNTAWNGSYTTSYKDVSKDVSLSNVTQLKIRIEATANSLYCQSFTITYTASVTSHTLSSAVSPAESGSVELSATSVAEGSKATATATPAAHYVFDHWSISGTGSSLSSTTTNPTTVTMGTADATVTATFVAAPKASITLSEAGATTTDATTYYVGDSYTLPSTTEAVCGTKVLVGWSTVTVSETDIKPASNFYEKGETVTLEASQTFYAVFANASGGGSPDMKIDFEGESSTYSDWTFTNLKSQQTGTITANGGTYYGTTGGTTASVTTINKIASPTSLTAYVSKQTKNTTSSTWYIRVSSDGSSWTNVKSQSATSMTKGSWVEMTADLTNYSDVYVQVYYEGANAVRNIDDLTLTIGGGTTYSAYSTSCEACVAPTSVTITGTNKYLGGQTISLTAAPEDGTGTPSYQWQKKISGVWKNLANDGSISGVTSNNLQISSCSYVNSGGYRCIVSTGDGCETKSHADGTDGYGVHVFSIHGKYTTDADYSDTEIIWTSETTGTATISMDAKKTYLFKVWSNNGYYYGHGANTNEDFMFQPTTWDCGVNNNEMRLFTTVAGNYTFTVNIEHGLDGSPYVNVQVGYPSMTHPNSGYVYVQKFNRQPYLHYWYDNSHPLSTWGSDPQLAANQYTSICGTDYWCVPVIDYYCNFIAKDAAGNPSNTTGDQHTNSPHPGQRLYNDGSWKWGEFSTYTITYAGGDGSTGGPMASHTGLCPGSSQQLTANAFSKSGYNFSGWTANVDVKIGGSTVPAGTLITGTPIIENVQSNITLTAQWTATTYTITYNGVKTGAENTNPTSYTVEDLPINLVAATHDQWRFDGWTDDNAGNADITTIPAGTTGNQSFTAHWTQRYAVTWYEESTPTIEYYDPGTTLQFPADPSAPASCSEKKFVGWMVGTITGETDDKPTFVTAGEVNDDAAYHAVWATQYEESGTKTLFNDQLLVTGTAAVSTPRDGWSDLSNVFGYSGNGVRLSSSKNGASMTVDLSGKELGSTLTITFDAAKYSSSENGSLSLSCLDDGANPTFTPASFTISNASWEEKSCTITNVDGKVASITLTGTKNQRFYMKNFKVTTSGMITKYKEYSTSCCDNNVAAPSVTATATRNSITLSWANVTDATGYKVTINGGTHEVTTAACTYTESGLTSGTDYAWTVVATYNPANYCGAIPTKNTTTTLSVYGVTYNKNTTIGSGTVTMSPMPSDASTYVVGENVTAAAKPTTCTNSGYTFNGWNTEPDGTGTHVDAGGTIAMVEGGLTLYAEWVAKRAYYVDRMHGQGDQTIEIGGKTYHCYYGDGYHTTPSPSDQKSGDACQAPHYRFVRWLTIGHINADGTQKDTGGAVSGGVQRGTVTDGETYYAIWEEEIE